MSNVNEAFGLLLEESLPVIEHTIKTTQNIFDEYKEETGKKVNIDGESLVDICTHLAIVYHMLVASTAEAIAESTDVNKGTQRTLRVIKQLSIHTNEYISPEIEAEANRMVNTIFARSRGTA